MLASLVVAAVLGCRRESATARREVPVAWLLDRQEPAEATGVAHGTPVAVAGERQRALASPQTFRATATVVHDPTPLQIDDLPDDVRAWGRAAIERSTDTAGHRQLVGTVIGLPANGPVRAPVAKTERLASSIEVRLRSVVPVERYDATTEPVTIPSDAVLAFGAVLLTVPGIAPV